MTAPEVELTRRTADDKLVTVEDGLLCHQGGTFTRHAALGLADSLVLAEAIGLFERTEMPSLTEAAAVLRRRGPVQLWPLVEMANRLSHRAGTRPAWADRPQRKVRLADAATPQDLAIRAQGYIVMPRPGRVAIVDEEDPR